MAFKHDFIDVRVSEQILWIDSDAYPLKGITRVGSGSWHLRRGPLVWQFLKSVAGWWLAGWLITTALTYYLSGSPELLGDQRLVMLPTLVLLALVVLTVIKAVRLASWLRFSFHKLDIETASSSTTALVSKDLSVVRDLATRITRAINNPAAEFRMTVENFHLGDNINMHGANSTVSK
jgi:hypothetical protein